MKKAINLILTAVIILGIPAYFDNGWLITVSWIPALIIKFNSNPFSNEYE